jgi:hypothetical protein
VCLYPGPPPQRRGARRTEDGKGNVQARHRFTDLGTRPEAPPLHLSTAVVWHKTRQRRLRLGSSAIGKPRPSRGALSWALRIRRCRVIHCSIAIPRGSRARFFSATANSALGSSTVRHVSQRPWICLATPHSQRALWCALRTGVCHRARHPRSSRASWKQGPCNERWLDVFMENFALDPTWVKNHACDEKRRAYGAIAA